MSKIICEICGTTYPASSEQCPICGYTHDPDTVPVADDDLQQVMSAERSHVKGGRFSAANVRRRNKNTPRYEPTLVDDEDDSYSYSAESQEKSNKPLVIILIVLIVLILLVAGFLAVRFLLPNIMGGKDDPIEDTTESTDQDTQIPTVPCTDLVLINGGSKELTEVGQYWLLNVLVLPEDCTDELVFTSSNEAVATVTDDGRVEAVGQGEAVITISCGEETLECFIVCVFEEEEPTENPEQQNPDEQENDGQNPDGQDPDEDTDPTESEEEPTEEPTEEPLKDITLEVDGRTDITITGIGKTFTFKLVGLDNSEVTWSSEDESIAVVDETGTVKTKGKGATTIYVQYGDQVVEIMVRVKTS